MSNEELIEIAKMAQKKAFAPVTSYGVGAALLTSSKTIYIGTNIEEYSIIGLSNCAERVAIQNAISHGDREIEKIAIVGGNIKTGMLDDNLSPCGVCLQYMLDFCKDVDIITYVDGKIVSKKITDYLSNPFELNKKESINNKD